MAASVFAQSLGEARSATPARFPVKHVIRGRAVETTSVTHPIGSGQELLTPALTLDELVWPRNLGFPTSQVPLTEVVDLLATTGRLLNIDTNEHVANAFEMLSSINPAGRRVMEEHYRMLPQLFDRAMLHFEHEQGLGGHGDGWHQVNAPDGASFDVRAAPSRMIHIMAGNSPQNAAIAIIRTSLIKGVSLLKLPSNDPFTAPAILITMSELAPTHPVVQSMSAVYWRGGDENVESTLMRAQFFDKVVAWGGEGAIKNVVRYLGPGLELVAFDPKSSISVVGSDAFRSQEELRQVASLAAADVSNQEGCASSRFQFVEGSIEEVDRYCESLLDSLQSQHSGSGGGGRVTPDEIRDEVECLRELEPHYRAWGRYDGSGLVVRSSEPVDFYPDARTVNVIRVADLIDAVKHITVATQTVGVYPATKKLALRDAFIGAGGVDRICDLGTSSIRRTAGLGAPHDGLIPLNRLARWIYCQR